MNGSGVSDTLIGITSVVVSGSNDTLVGSSNDVLQVTGGSDVIFAGSGGHADRQRRQASRQTIRRHQRR